MDDDPGCCPECGVDSARCASYRARPRPGKCCPDCRHYHYPPPPGAQLLLLARPLPTTAGRWRSVTSAGRWMPWQQTLSLATLQAAAAARADGEAWLVAPDLSYAHLERAYKDVPLRAQRNTSGQQGPAPKLKREMNQSRIEHLRKVASGELTVDPDQMLSMALQVLSGRTGEAHDVVGRILDPSLTKKGSGYTTGKQFIEDPANTSVALVLLCAGASMLDTYSSTRLLLPALLDATGYEPVAGEGEWLEKDLKAHRAQLAQREKEAAARNAKTTKPGD